MTPICIYAGPLILLHVSIIGVPSVVRADMGTDNTIITFLQPFLRRHEPNGEAERSFRHRRSVSNQVLDYVIAHFICH